MADTLIVWIGQSIVIRAEGFAALCIVALVLFCSGALAVVLSWTNSGRNQVK